MSQKIWLSKPHLSQFEEKYVNRAFSSNWITTIGDNINEFEYGIKNFLGTKKEIVALNSGTSAIHLALILLGVKKNDEVICPSFTFCATANPILYLGAKPIFVDSELDTWNMCPYYLEKAIISRISKGKKPKAIIVVDSYGMPAKWDEISSISKKYSIPIVEDSAEALGSSYKGRNCGLFGDFGVYSFNGNKIITTSSGGALICDNTSDKKEAISIATQANTGSDFYEHKKLGYNYRMSNVLAGIGMGQLEVLNDRIIKRREVNFFYKKIIQDYKGITLQKEPNNNFYSNFWLSCILLDPQKCKYSIKEFMNFFDKNNIQVRHLWKPLHTQKLYNKEIYFGNGNCNYLYQNGICLPSSSNLSNEELIRIKDIFNLN